MIETWLDYNTIFKPLISYTKIQLKKGIVYCIVLNINKELTFKF
jgi:hypothetical protein